MPHHRAPILVIDDDATLRDLAREALTEGGYDALTLRTHAAGLRALAARRFALVLADTAGPMVADPWPALDAVRGAAGGTPVVIFSARRPDAFAGYAGRGFAGLIAKPFDLDDLLATVDGLLSA